MLSLQSHWYIEHDNSLSNVEAKLEERYNFDVVGSTSRQRYVLVIQREIRNSYLSNVF